jgi:hypothetical protein
LIKKGKKSILKKRLQNNVCSIWGYGGSESYLEETKANAVIEGEGTEASQGGG